MTVSFEICFCKMDFCSRSSFNACITIPRIIYEHSHCHRCVSKKSEGWLTYMLKVGASTLRILFFLFFVFHNQIVAVSIISAQDSKVAVQRSHQQQVHREMHHFSNAP